MSGIALAMSHRHSGIFTYGFIAKGREMITVPVLLQRGMAQVTLLVRTVCVVTVGLVDCCGQLVQTQSCLRTLLACTVIESSSGKVCAPANVISVMNAFT